MTTANNQPILRPVPLSGIRWVGLTAAAKKLKVSRGHLSLVLNGYRKPGPRLARGLAAMGVDVSQQEVAE